jgi:hypothetical protein
VQRVVADARVQPEFQVVRLTAGARQHLADLRTEVPLDLEHKPTRLPRGILRTPAEQLIDVGVHTGGRLSGADRAENHDARVEAPLRDRQPGRRRRRTWIAERVRLAQDQERAPPVLGLLVRR